MHAQPQAEHQWLQKLIGEWTIEAECEMGPGQPLEKTRGASVVRSLGGLWTIDEGQGDMPGGGTAHSIMTLGFDPLKGKYVGTFIASVMTFLWQYEGTLDTAKNILTLDTMGPDFAGGAQLVAYQDVIAFINDDYRTLSSQMKTPSGEWHMFMTAHYRRKK